MFFPTSQLAGGCPAQRGLLGGEGTRLCAEDCDTVSSEDAVTECSKYRLKAEMMLIKIVE